MLVKLKDGMLEDGYVGVDSEILGALSLRAPVNKKTNSVLKNPFRLTVASDGVPELSRRGRVGQVQERAGNTPYLCHLTTNAF